MKLAIIITHSFADPNFGGVQTMEYLYDNLESATIEYSGFIAADQASRGYSHTNICISEIFDRRAKEAK